MISEKDFEGIGNNLVVKHNDLFKVGFSQLNLNEKKLVCAFLSKVNSQKKIDSKTAFVLTIDEASEIFEVNFKNRSNVDYFKRLAYNLRKKGGKIISDTGSWVEFSISQGAEYNKEKQTFTLYFSDFMIPYISNITKNFSSYKFLHVAKMKQNASIDIYENLVFWMGSDSNSLKTREKILSIDDLKIYLGIPETKYENNYSGLKRRVLMPAVEEINKITDFNLEVEELKRHQNPKKSKTITHLKFIFSKKQEWLLAENKYKNSKKISNDVANGVIANGGFFDEYFGKGEFGGLSPSEFMKKAKEILLGNNPDKHFPDFRKYLK